VFFFFLLLTSGSKPPVCAPPPPPPLTPCITTRLFPFLLLFHLATSRNGPAQLVLPWLSLLWLKSSPSLSRISPIFITRLHYSVAGRSNDIALPSSPAPPLIVPPRSFPLSGLRKCCGQISFLPGSIRRSSPPTTPRGFSRSPPLHSRPTFGRFTLYFSFSTSRLQLFSLIFAVSSASCPPDRNSFSLRHQGPVPP